jgi:DNA replication initiation complex subunit (GINS family)
VLSKEGQTLIRNMGRVISRSDIAQEDFTKSKIIPEEPAIAERLNAVIEEYKRYMQ